MHANSMSIFHGEQKKMELLHIQYCSFEILESATISPVAVANIYWKISLGIQSERIIVYFVTFIGNALKKSFPFLLKTLYIFAAACANCVSFFYSCHFTRTPFAANSYLCAQKFIRISVCLANDSFHRICNIHSVYRCVTFVVACLFSTYSFENYNII